jgi:hypothetical protein
MHDDAAFRGETDPDEALERRVASLIGDIEAAKSERRAAPVRAARVRLAAFHGMKRLRKRLAEEAGRAA